MSLRKSISLRSFRILVSSIIACSFFVACGVEDDSLLDCFGGGRSSKDKSGSTSKSDRRGKNTDKSTGSDPICTAKINGKVEEGYSDAECLDLISNSGGTGTGSSSRDDAPSSNPFDKPSSSGGRDLGEF